MSRTKRQLSSKGEDLKLCFRLTEDMVGGLIGRSGGNIARIRRIAQSATIQDDSDRDGRRMFTVTGTRKQCRAVIKHLQNLTTCSSLCKGFANISVTSTLRCPEPTLVTTARRRPQTSTKLIVSNTRRSKPKRKGPRTPVATMKVQAHIPGPMARVQSPSLSTTHQPRRVARTTAMNGNVRNQETNTVSSLQAKIKRMKNQNEKLNRLLVHYSTRPYYRKVHIEEAKKLDAEDIAHERRTDGLQDILKLSVRTKCPGCLEGEKDFAFVPCGHVFCEQCAHGTSPVCSAPQCGMQIARRVRLYYS